MKFNRSYAVVPGRIYLFNSRCERWVFWEGIPAVYQWDFEADAPGEKSVITRIEPNVVHFLNGIVLSARNFAHMNDHEPRISQEEKDIEKALREYEILKERFEERLRSQSSYNLERVIECLREALYRP